MQTSENKEVRFISCRDHHFSNGKFVASNRNKSECNTPSFSHPVSILKSNVNEFPVFGNLYFQADYSENEYLRLDFNDKIVNGRLYIHDGLLGPVYFDISGRVLTTKVVEIEINYKLDGTKEFWAYHLKENKLELLFSESRSNEKGIMYTPVECYEVKDGALYEPFTKKRRSAKLTVETPTKKGTLNEHPFL